MVVEWDHRKAAANAKKHGVSLQEAASVLRHTLCVTFRDPDQSLEESRFLTICLSSFGRIRMLAHTERAEAVRLISARRATQSERRFHEED